MPTTAHPVAAAPRRSVFAGADVCHTAGLALLPDAKRPVFEQDVWDLTGLADAHRGMRPHAKVFNFTRITNPTWRVVAKELVLALLAPGHEAVTHLPNAFRAARGPQTCAHTLDRLTEWLNWLTAHGVVSLGEIIQEHCDAYLQDRSWNRHTKGPARRPVAAGTLSLTVRTMQSLVLYRELFSTDSYRSGFMPWNGRNPNQIAGRHPGGENATPTVPDALLQPLLANCLYLVDIVGPHLADLHDRARAASTRMEALSRCWLTDDELAAVRQAIRDHVQAGSPLPELAPGHVRRRLRGGWWSPNDPLLPVHFGSLARAAGCDITKVGAAQIQLLRPDLEQALARVGVAGEYGRDAAPVARADTGDPIPWTTPMTDFDVRLTTGHVLTACLILTAAVSGMRWTELVELVGGCRLPPIEVPGGGPRFRLAGRLIKGHRLGGITDEWGVIAEVDRAVALAERLTGAAPGQPLFGQAVIGNRFRAFRPWLAGPFATHLGLAPLPDGPLNGRMLRRTLAVELAKRPGGLLAVKIHLKHVSVVILSSGFDHGCDLDGHVKDDVLDVTIVGSCAVFSRVRSLPNGDAGRRVWTVGCWGCGVLAPGVVHRVPGRVAGAAAGCPG